MVGVRAFGLYSSKQHKFGSAISIQSQSREGDEERRGNVAWERKENPKVRNQRRPSSHTHTQEVQDDRLLGERGLTVLGINRLLLEPPYDRQNLGENALSGLRGGGW